MGSNQALIPRLTNEVRVNYSRVTRMAFSRSTISVAPLLRPTLPYSLRLPRRRIQPFGFMLLGPLWIKFNKGKLGIVGNGSDVTDTRLLLSGAPTR